MASKRRERPHKNGKTRPEDEPQLPVPMSPPRHEPPGGDKPRRRTASVTRRTRETDVTVLIDLDGSGRADIDTGLRTFDHLLETLAHHGLFDLRVVARGDLEVDPHHTVEDVGLCIGRALLDAAGDREGIVRFGQAAIPFDETLVRAYVDFGGRPAFEYRVAVPAGRIGNFDVELAEVFFQAVANEARMNLHLVLDYGRNRHHIVEACFKALARALDLAVAIDARRVGVPSTKGRFD